MSIRDGKFIVVTDENGNDFTAIETSKNADETVNAFVLVDKEENGFGWPKGGVQYAENLKDQGNGKFGA